MYVASFCMQKKVVPNTSPFLVSLDMKVEGEDTAECKCITSREKILKKTCDLTRNKHKTAGQNSTCIFFFRPFIYDYYMAGKSKMPRFSR